MRQRILMADCGLRIGQLLAAALLIFVVAGWAVAQSDPPNQKPETSNQELTALQMLILISGGSEARGLELGPQSLEPENPTPGAFLAAGGMGVFAGNLAYKPGVGGCVSFGSALPIKNLYATADFDVVHQEKTYLEDGHTIRGAPGLQYHFTPSWFARAAVAVAHHSNSTYGKTATRLHLGGGYSYYRRGSRSYGDLPLLTVTAVGFVAIDDPNNGRGVKISAQTFYPVGAAWGLHARAAVSSGRYDDSLSGRRGNASHTEFNLGFFVNLSAIAGS